MATELDRKIGLRLAQYRRQAGMTQLQVADKLGVTYQQVHKLECAINRISANRAIQLAAIFGVPIEELLRPDGRAPKRPLRPRHELEIAQLFRAMDAKRQEATMVIIRAIAT